MPHLWPPLSLEAWQDTCTTLHLWTQIVGKIRLVQTPWINHSWHVPLYLTARGLTTGTIPHDDQIFQIDFDFLDHQLRIVTSAGLERTLALQPRTMADFYQAVMAALAELGVAVRIHTTPNEIPDAIPFEQDDTHGAYDAEAAQRFWRVLLQSDRVFREFRSHFCGKVSPVHFFWGSFDLAVTRFSGRPAPPHPGGVPNLPDDVAQEEKAESLGRVGTHTTTKPLDSGDTVNDAVVQGKFTFLFGEMIKRPRESN